MDSVAGGTLRSRPQVNTRSSHRSTGCNDCARHPVQGTSDTESTPVQNVSVDLRRLDAGVAQQLLNRANVVAVMEEMRSEGVAKRVRSGMLRDLGSRCSFSDSFLDY